MAADKEEKYERRKQAIIRNVEAYIDMLYNYENDLENMVTDWNNNHGRAFNLFLFQKHCDREQCDLCPHAPYWVAMIPTRQRKFRKVYIGKTVSRQILGKRHVFILDKDYAYIFNQNKLLHQLILNIKSLRKKLKSFTK